MDATRTRRTKLAAVAVVVVGAAAGACLSWRPKPSDTLALPQCTESALKACRSDADCCSSRCELDGTSGTCAFAPPVTTAPMGAPRRERLAKEVSVRAPAAQGQSFSVNVPPAARPGSLTAKEVLEESVLPALRAIGFEGDASRFAITAQEPRTSTYSFDALA